MGGSQSVEIPGGGTEGYHVLRVQENSPGQRAGLEAFFDFIVAVGNQRLNTDNDVLKEILKQHVERPLELTVFNSKAQTIRQTQIVPSQCWGGQGLLGISIRFCSFEGASQNVWHVLDVNPNSPAAIAGLRANTDYILGAESVLNDADDLFSLVQANEGKPMKLFVYNVETDAVREITLTPNTGWGGEGSLGCDIGYGYLHRIPAYNERTSDKSAESSLAEPVPTIDMNQQVPSSSNNVVTSSTVTTTVPLPTPNAPISKLQPIYANQPPSTSAAHPAPVVMNGHGSSDLQQGGVMTSAFAPYPPPMTSLQSTGGGETTAAPPSGSIVTSPQQQQSVVASTTASMTAHPSTQQQQFRPPGGSTYAYKPQAPFLPQQPPSMAPYQPTTTNMSGAGSGNPPPPVYFPMPPLSSLGITTSQASANPMFVPPAQSRFPAFPPPMPGAFSPPSIGGGQAHQFQASTGGSVQKAYFMPPPTGGNTVPAQQGGIPAFSTQNQTNYGPPPPMMAATNAYQPQQGQGSAYPNYTQQATPYNDGHGHSHNDGHGHSHDDGHGHGGHGHSH